MHLHRLLGTDKKNYVSTLANDFDSKPPVKGEMEVCKTGFELIAI